MPDVPEGWRVDTSTAANCAHVQLNSLLYFMAVAW
jgi:hypothetical protein